jgi:hypothetical protein
MFRRSTTQGSLWESPFQMSDRKRGRLDKTWAKTFREQCLPLIDEELFRPLYCADNGAPCKSIRVVVAVDVLRHIFDLTYAETQAAVDFDLRWHLALGLDPCDDQDYVSPRTLQYFEAKLIEQNLVGALFSAMTDKLLARLGVKTGRQRLDTTHLLSNFARLTRLGLFCETQRVLLKALTHEASSLPARIPLSLRLRYLREDGADSSYDDARASDTRRRLAVAARDAYRLREALRGVELPADSAAAYAILERLVAEHCEIVAAPQLSAEGDGDTDLPPVPVVAKEAKTLTGAVLQTPHDPAVTFSGHKGQGYEALLAETCDPENAVQLITHASLERSCESDADRVLPLVEELAARGITPETLLADTAFGSVENVAGCARREVELIAPQPGGASRAESEPTLCVRDDELSVQLLPSQPPSICPCGVAALETVLRDDPLDGPVALLRMPTASCAACPRRGWCPALTLENGETLVLIVLRENLPPRRRAAERTAAFQDAYRPRAGIEGTNSEVKRGQGLDHLRVRGEKRVELALMLKLTACNVKRALNYWGKQVQTAKIDATTGVSALKTALTRLAKKFRGLWDGLSPTESRGWLARAYTAAAA